MNKYMVVWGANGFGNDAKFFDDYNQLVSFVHGLFKSILADVILIYQWDSESDTYVFMREV